MAQNLRANIPASDVLVVYDRNTEATAKFVQEIGAGVEVANSPRGVAERSVRAISTPVLFQDEIYRYPMMSMFQSS